MMDRDISSKAVAGFVVVFVLSCIALVLFRGAMVSDEAAMRALTTAGYSEVVLGDKQIFFVNFSGCSNDDTTKFNVVSAIGPNGKKVADGDVYVCAGWPFKGATPRYR